MVELKKIYGLELQSNSFKPREGALEIASNVVLAQDDIITKRRGNRSFYSPTAITARSLGEYGGKVLGFCADRVQVYNQDAAGAFSSVSTLSGKAFTIASGEKARTVEASGNLYFTADGGVMKLESTTGSVLNSGIAAATDLQVVSQETSATETFFRPDSQIAFRVVFGRKDANNNLVLGAPSQILAATNGVTQASSASISTTTVTVNTSAAHGLSVSDIVYIVEADGTAVPDGAYTVSAVPTSTSFEFEANSGTVSTLKWGTYKIPTLEWAIPSEIDSAEFLYRLYRTKASAAADIPPDESTLQLVEERNLTSGQISTGFVVYKDETPDILRGAYLYTNPNTGEARGIAEANEKPPKAKDLAVFKGHVFFANVETPYTLTLNLITSDSSTLPDGSEVVVTSGGTARTYVGHAGPKVGNRTVRSTSVSVSSTTVTVTYAGHGLGTGDEVAIAEALDSSGAEVAGLSQGVYTVSNATTNTFDVTAQSTPTGLQTVSFQGLETSAGKRIFYIEHSSSSSVAAAIDATARALVRAVNRDSSASCVAYYTSPVDGIPGKMLLRSKTTLATFYLTVGSSTISESFSPTLPTTGETVSGKRADGQGVLQFSKPNEPEAVPTANEIIVGSRSKAILRIKPLKDTLIVIKEDGVYRVNGSDYTSFVATILDSTVICKAADSVAVLNNQVFCVSDQGVVAISETSVSIVSRPIEPLLTAVLGKSYFSDETHAVSYESERLYLLTTVRPSSETADRVYCYNDKTGGWTTWTTTFLDAIVKRADDKLYLVDLENEIYQERKNQNRLDFCDEDFDVTILTTPTSSTATLSVVGGTPAVGDIVVVDDIINRITEVTSDGATLVYTFARDFSFEASDTGKLYKGVSSQIRFSPITAGSVMTMKQFSEFQAAFRNNTSVSRLSLYFITDTVAGSTSTDWTSIVQGEGWGEAPWGQFPWGLEEGIDQVYTTNPAQPLRTYIPLEAQRATFIQPDIQHSAAAEHIALQAIGVLSRSYGQRTTR